MPDHPLAASFWSLVRRFRAKPALVPGSALVVPTPVDVAAAMRDLDAVRARCRALVTKRATLSAGAAIVPIPGLDVGTDVAILVKLLPRISEAFGLAPHQVESLDVETKRLVMVFASAVGSQLVGRLVTRELVTKLLFRMGVRLTTQGVVKYVPLVGQALSASISFGAMKLIGDRHVDDCYEVARRALVETATTATVVER